MKHQSCCGCFTRHDRHKKWCTTVAWDDSQFITTGWGQYIWPFDLPFTKRFEQDAIRHADEMMKILYPEEK